ncbi:MAG TPA: RidA family protein [Longimicrobium sp.]|nr:RidA family protein [Longimicrobium sp.]
MKLIQTEEAPIPAGHYSQAVVHQGVVYVAGQLPVRPDRQQDEEPLSIEEQTERALRNVEAILNAAGSGLDLVLQMTVYIADMSLWSRVNAVFARVLGDHRPARAIVPTPDLHHAYQIEIQTIAAVRD